MKKKFYLVLAIIACMVCIGIQNNIFQTQSVSNLALENVEALASGGEYTNYTCFGEGSVDCPDGTTAKRVYILTK
jgi:hypothetical protein